MYGSEKVNYNQYERALRFPNTHVYSSLLVALHVEHNYAGSQRDCANQY